MAVCCPQPKASAGESPVVAEYGSQSKDGADCVHRGERGYNQIRDR